MNGHTLAINMLSLLINLHFFNIISRKDPNGTIQISLPPIIINFFSDVDSITR